MYAIQFEDEIHEESAILPHLAVDDESAVFLMHFAAGKWIEQYSPEGLECSLYPRNGALDIVTSGQVVLATYTVFAIEGIMSVHGAMQLPSDVKA